MTPTQAISAPFQAVGPTQLHGAPTVSIGVVIPPPAAGTLLSGPAAALGSFLLGPFRWPCHIQGNACLPTASPPPPLWLRAREPLEALGQVPSGAAGLPQDSGRGGCPKNPGAAAFGVARARLAELSAQPSITPAPVPGGGQAPPGHPRKNFSLTNIKSAVQLLSDACAPARDRTPPPRLRSRVTSQEGSVRPAQLRQTPGWGCLSVSGSLLGSLPHPSC